MIRNVYKGYLVTLLNLTSPRHSHMVSLSKEFREFLRDTFPDLESSATLLGAMNVKAGHVEVLAKATNPALRKRRSQCQVIEPNGTRTSCKGGGGKRRLGSGVRGGCMALSCVT